MGLLDGIKRIVGNSDRSEVLSTENDKKMIVYMKNVEKINELEEHFEKFSDEKLCDMTKVFQQKLQNGSSLDSIIVEAFAVVREASWRVLELRHFNEQV